MADVIRKMAEGHTVADIDGVIDEVAAARGDYESLEARLDDLPSGEDEGRDRAALTELIDNGAKNILQIGTAVTAAKNGVTAVSNTDGSITISGVSTSENQFVIINDLYSGSTSSTYGSQIPIKEGGYTIKATGIEGVRVQAINYNSSNDGTTIASSDEDVNFTAAKSFIVFRLVIMPGADFTTPVTIYPMCCDSKLYAVSKAYQPYRPSYQELYDEVQEKITKSQVYNRGTAINTGDDLDDYTSFGKFNAATGAIATSLTNCPITTGFVMTVEESFQGGKMQTLVTIESGGNATITYRRSQVYRSSVWSWLPWYKFEGTAVT